MSEDGSARQMWCWMTDIIPVISLQITFPHQLTIEPAQGQHHGFSHETMPMAIKKTNNFLCTLAHFRLLRVRTCCCHGSRAVFCVRAAFRQPSEVLRTPNRKKLVVRLNRFSLLPSSFREGRGDAQTQQAETEHPTFPQWYPLLLSKKKKKKSAKTCHYCWCSNYVHYHGDSSTSAFLIKLKVICNNVHKMFKGWKCT